MDIEIVLAVAVATVFLVVLLAIGRRRKRQYDAPGIHVYNRRPYPHVIVVETNTGFDEVMIMGCALNAGQCEAQSIVVNEVPVEDPAPVFSGFGGGDSAGGGATSDSCPMDSSPSDGSSSCDTASSYDSSSSSNSGGDF